MYVETKRKGDRRDDLNLSKLLNRLTANASSAWKVPLWVPIRGDSSRGFLISPEDTFSEAILNDRARERWGELMCLKRVFLRLMGVWLLYQLVRLNELKLATVEEGDLGMDIHSSRAGARDKTIYLFPAGVSDGPAESHTRPGALQKTWASGIDHKHLFRMSQQSNIVTTTQVGPRGIPEALFIVSHPSLRFDDLITSNPILTS